MTVVKVRTKYQVTIPEKVRRQVGLEVGDYVEVEAQGSEIVIIPKSEIDKGDAWFWSKEWQEKEREADEAIKKGELIGPFETNQEAIEALKKTRA
ncbi:MAG TPA: AbrB/MazE/SpoVT family DNA-binding domain-containing protein [Candidatus Acetothermia bacterium]|nr:AbrB/MazE/SpoVT family DNA-binding domain-containing protein [Candidatus Acetothermia bacterium]